MTRDACLHTLLEAQAYVLSRDQALDAGLSRRAIEHRLATRAWRMVLPSIYVTSPGGMSRVQAQVAALLYAGEAAALDDVDACRLAGLTAARRLNGVVFVVAPEGSRARSRGFVRVRRSSQSLITLWTTHWRRYLVPAQALVAMSRRVRSEREVLAAFSEAVQRRVVTLEQLVAAHESGSPKFAAVAELALGDLGAGVLSAPEGTFRRLADASSVIGPLLYNRRLRLPTGRVVAPDALAPEARLVHETNGRGPHEREDLFDSMQERHDAMTAAGLIVLHNSPRRLRRARDQVLAEFEQCYRDNYGRGLPPGVELLND